MDGATMREAGRLVTLLFAAALALDANTANAAVEISTRPTANMTCSGGVCTPTAKDAILNVSDLINMLASGDTSVNTGGSIARDIKIDAALTWISSNHLTLDAYHSIMFNKPVTIGGSGALTITTNDGGSGGDYRFFGKGHIKFSNTTGQLEINGEAYTLVYSIKELKQGIRLNSGGRFALAKSINARRRPYTVSPILGGFTGVFEGLGNTISDLKITNLGGALFQQLGFNFCCLGVIRDLGLLSVNISGNGFNAALVAGNAGTIANCFATGQVSLSGNGGYYAAGLVNANVGVIENSYADVAVSASGYSIVGGLVAINLSDCNGDLCNSQALITGSFSRGSVIGYHAGGLVGINQDAAIVNSFSSGAVASFSSGESGGLVGLYKGSHPAYSALRTSYSSGAVMGGTFVGGFIGDDEVQANITNTHWDLDTSGISDPSRGAGNIQNDAGITGLSDEQLKSGLPSGFDRKVWKIKSGVNSGYPYLIDNPPR